jgi:hypothetical protein
MVPVRVGEDERIFETLFANEPIAEHPDAGTGIDNDDSIVFRPYFQAGGAPAVFQVFLA